MPRLLPRGRRGAVRRRPEPQRPDRRAVRRQRRVRPAVGQAPAVQLHEGDQTPEPSEVGVLDLAFDMLHLPNALGHPVMTYTAVQGTATQQSLALRGSTSRPVRHAPRGRDRPGLRPEPGPLHQVMETAVPAPCAATRARDLSARARDRLRSIPRFLRSWYQPRGPASGRFPAEGPDRPSSWTRLRLGEFMLQVVAAARALTTKRSNVDADRSYAKVGEWVDVRRRRRQSGLDRTCWRQRPNSLRSKGSTV